MRVNNHLIKVLLSILVLASALNIAEAKSATSYTKTEKDIVKAIKSQYKPKSIELIKCEDGFKYHELKTKDGVYFILDSIGEIIIPAKYEYNTIMFIPESRFQHKDLYMSQGAYDAIEILALPVERTFVASKNYGLQYGGYGSPNPTFFYNDKGEIIKIYDEQLELIGNSLFRTKNSDAAPLYGLINGDGRIIIPIEYKYIIPRANSGDWYLNKMVDGFDSWGIYNIGVNKEVVPCIFDKIELSNNNQYMVRLFENDPLEPYDPKRDYSKTYSNLGEKYYRQKRYRDAIAYYENNDTIAAGKIIANLSYYYWMSGLLESYNRNLEIVSSDNYSLDYSSDLRLSFNDFKSALNSWDVYYQKNKSDIRADAFPGFQDKYDEAITFLFRYNDDIKRMDNEVNLMISSYHDRRRDYQIAEERRRQERIRAQQREQEYKRREREERERYEREKRRRDQEKWREEQKRKEEANKRNNANSRPVPHNKDNKSILPSNNKSKAGVIQNTLKNSYQPKKLEESKKGKK